MKNKKIIYIGFFAIVLFAMISFVSAGFGDWIKGLFGEPQLGPFNATVTIQSLPPNIVRIFNVTDDFVSSGVDSVLPTPDSASNVYVTFLADDPNGRTDLPTTLTIGTNVDLNLTYSGVRATTSSYIGSSASADTCVEVTNCGSCSSNQRMYFCNLSSAMQFYYQPNFTANLWFTSTRISDITLTFGPANNTFGFTYRELADVLNIVNLTWYGISPSGTNQKATDNVTLINKGNRLLKSVNITAYNLTGSNYPGTKALIPANTIRANGTIGTECNSIGTTTFWEHAGLNVTIGNLDYGPSEQRSLHFCIFPALNALPEYAPGGLDLGNSPYTARGPLVGGNINPATGTSDWRLQLV